MSFIYICRGFQSWVKSSNNLFFPFFPYVIVHVCLQLEFLLIGMTRCHR